MITDEMLYRAAARSSAAFTEQREADYDPAGQHEFSGKFERKIQRLKRKADHPVLYRTMQRVASILLAILITGSAWITVDAEARAAVVGWVKEIYETYFVFRHDKITNTATESADYRPTWLPDGYSEFRVNASETRTVVIYANDAGETIRFNYIHNPDEADWFIDVSQASIKNATVNGSKADLLIAQNPEEANAIAWVSADTAFYVIGFVDENELVKIAESVQVIK